MEFASPAAGDRVLDVCCGTGQLTAMIASRGFPGQIIGVDISESAIEIAGIKYQHIPVTFLKASARDLPFDASRFDKCFLSLGLHHMSQHERQKTLAEIHRTLAHKGTLYVIDYNLPEKGLRQISAITFAKLDKSKEAYEMLKNGKLIREIQKAGFEIEKRVLTCQRVIQLLQLVKK